MLASLITQFSKTIETALTQTVVWAEAALVVNLGVYHVTIRFNELIHHQVQYTTCMCNKKIQLELETCIVIVHNQ